MCCSRRNHSSRPRPGKIHGSLLTVHQQIRRKRDAEDSSADTSVFICPLFHSLLGSSECSLRQTDDGSGPRLFRMGLRIRSWTILCGIPSIGDSRSFDSSALGRSTMDGPYSTYLGTMRNRPEFCAKRDLVLHWPL